MQEPQLFAVVALRVGIPELGLVAGQVGTLVEALEPGVYEVEFSDQDGRTYATAALSVDDVMVLHYEPTAAA